MMATAGDTDFKAVYLDVIRNVDNDVLPKAEGLSLQHIGDGNLNYVLRVTDSGGRAVVMKLAPGHIKCIGPEYPLTAERARLDYDCLVLYEQTCPGSVSKPLHYSDQHKAMLMEYLDDYEVQKSALISGKVDKVAADQLAKHLARIHARFHKDNVTAEEFQQLKDKFRNDALCDLTQKFIFTLPFIQGNKLNKVKPAVLAAAEQRVFSNQTLLADVADFKRKFFTEETLVHGDLHTGSVMVKDGMAKIIDAEFVYVGPMAFDLGLLVAHYMVTYHQHMLTEEDNDRHRRVSYKMMDVIRDTVSTYLRELKARLPSLSEDAERDLLSDVAGFAACELMRRVLGTAHVPDVEHSEGMELEVLESGIRLMGARRNVTDVGRLLLIGLALC